MAKKKDITKDSVAFARKINEYFAFCDNADESPSCRSCKDGESEKCSSCRKKQVPYTLSGLCLFLGITKRQFNSLKSNKCFSDAVDMALLKIESYIEENSYCGNINGTLATAVLRENFGWGEDDAPDLISVELSAEADGYGG
ncbi:MAG: hypothetical protein KBS59_03065 [Clostridiales bacterium]|nr:hypothetical protein [Clostridiales bacterium]